jgi:hypothetical protein
MWRAIYGFGAERPRPLRSQASRSARLRACYAATAARPETKLKDRRISSVRLPRRGAVREITSGTFGGINAKPGGTRRNARQRNCQIATMCLPALAGLSAPPSRRQLAPTGRQEFRRAPQARRSFYEHTRGTNQENSDLTQPLVACYVDPPPSEQGNTNVQSDPDRPEFPAPTEWQ